MNLLKFINLFFKVKSVFSYLPRGLQEDAVDDMQDLYELCVLSKYEKLKGKV